MPFQIIRNDITRVAADAIVNTANPQPVIGGGTDSAIYSAAGEEQLLAERQKIGPIEPGNAAVTPAFRLNAKYIIHTVGPAWINGNQGERETLHACYANSLSLAAELGCESIAFPLIATGVYGFPKDEALDIALAECGKFLLTHEMEITLVVFDRKAFKLSEKLVGEIDEYIDEHSVGRLRRKEYERDLLNRSQFSGEFEEKFRGAPIDRRILEAPKKKGEPFWKRFRKEEAPTIETDADELYSPMSAPVTAPKATPDFSGKSLDDILNNQEDTFQQRLFHLIDERGLDDVTVYKKANVKRQNFSKIRCNPDYTPSKKTAVAFAISLQLNMEETRDLLSRAEIALSPGNKFDLIISYCIENKKYDIDDVNAILFAYDQPLLGYA